MPARSFVSWIHFGDLHITESGAPNHRDLLTLIEVANTRVAGAVDFALLPGDSADDGTAEQFGVVRRALDRLAVPVRVVPGDHDFASGSLAAFYDGLGCERLPAAFVAGYCRCLLLDVVSAGSGGPDFRLDAAQLDWLEVELRRADAAGQRALVFSHVYPDDLRDGAERLSGLLRRHRVACVDMGHTHYNELSNDGGTIFMATRSTGQLEEGPVGFSVAALDRGVVSWRFQPLGGGWPLVLITSPADHRLIVDPGSHDQLVESRLRIGAKVMGAGPSARVTASIDDGPPFELGAERGDTSMWCAQRAVDLSDGLHTLAVVAHDATGARGEDCVRFLADREGRYDAPFRYADGSDRDALRAWPERHLLGTQLGPNRNGKAW